MHKIGQSGGFLGRLIGPLVKTGLPLIKNVVKPLGKRVLMPLGLTATDAAIHKKMVGLGVTTLIIWNEKMNDIMKLVKSLKKPGLLIKGVSKIIKNETKEQKGGFLSMLLGTLYDSLLGTLLKGKGTIGIGESTITAGQEF